MWTIALLLCMVGLSHTHHCLLSPPQRTPLVGINKMMAPACYQNTAPCGNTTASTPNLEVRAGGITRVVFEKNMAHFNKDNPGYYTISIGKEDGSLTELKRFTDPGDPAIFIYSVDVTIPATLDASQNYILQVKHTKNTGTGSPYLYQCADIGVFGGSSVQPIGK
ncbi:uncharacterized protein LOC135464212 [Liolophura sinensis]|uniref:uncharacterized protein LOC135464212 n=1 Tax=Liolophura sinensis TaxID=3198878 RepID=UPI003159673E